VAAQDVAGTHQDVLSMLAHDLGTLSSAFALRLDVVESLLPPADAAALRTLVEQLRDIRRTLRLVDGPRREELLDPARAVPLVEWWRLAVPVLQSVVPRGVRIEGVVTDGMVSAQQAQVLLLLLHGACRGLASSLGEPPVLVRCVIAPLPAGAEGAQVSMDVAHVHWRPVDAPRRAPTWARRADRLATRSGAQHSWWTLQEEHMRWSCLVGAASTAHNGGGDAGTPPSRNTP
jgi:hypothetical protein